MSEIEIREYRDGDPIPEITALLHRAYRPLLDQGLKFVATAQDDATTLDRLTSGYSLVAEREGKIVGTITVYEPAEDESCDYYRREGLLYFGQFAVEPTLQGEGLGRQLLTKIETYARTRGAKELALDTSNQATHLIARYENWGFQIVSSVDWGGTNYVSVVMSKKL